MSQKQHPPILHPLLVFRGIRTNMHLKTWMHNRQSFKKSSKRHTQVTTQVNYKLNDWMNSNFGEAQLKGRAVADKLEIPLEPLFITSTKKKNPWYLHKVDSNRERQIITTENSIRELVPNNNKTKVLVYQNLQNFMLNLHLHVWKFSSYENFSLEILLVLICNNNGSNELEL